MYTDPNDVGFQAVQKWAGFWHSLYFRHHKQWMWRIGQIPAIPGILMAGKDTIEKSGILGRSKDQMHLLTFEAESGRI